MPDTATTITLIDACGQAGVAVMLSSYPGVGKSSMVRGLAKALDEECWVILGSVREPSDFGGLPVVRDDGVILYPPGWARSLIKARKGFLLLDELPRCPPAVQNAMLGVALDRAVGDEFLPPGVTIVACGNPADISLEAWALDPALANRFCHLKFTPSFEEWAHGEVTGWAAVPASRAVGPAPGRLATLIGSITGFLKDNRTELWMGYPKTAAEAAGPWPSPRTWSLTARVLAHLRDDDIEARDAAMGGLVGEGATIEYLHWLEAADMPGPAEILADPGCVDWAGDSGRVWAALAGVVAFSTAGGGSQDRWRKAWGPLVAAADGGAFDTALGVSAALLQARPNSATPPASARKLMKFLNEAGLGAPLGAEPAGPEPEP